MDNEEKNYIREQVDADYIIKSKNSAMAFFLVAIIFLFIQKYENDYRLYNSIFVCGVAALSLLRILNVNRYLDKKLTLQEAVRNVSVTATLNAFLWCLIGTFSVLSFNQMSIHILITFIILIAFSAGSIVTLSHKVYTFLAVNILVLFPQIFYSFVEYNRYGETTGLWLLSYTAIYIVYLLRQSSVIQKELTKNFATEYELKKSLQEIALSKKHLEEESIKTFHASRLSSLGQMAGGVAHEINNPLTIIQGMTKSILNHKELQLDEQIRIKLGKINSASERIAKIVKGMKIISSKNDQVEHEAVHISKILELSLGLFEEKLKNENVTLHLENITDPIIKCNSLQISQIVINLLSNALDAVLKENSERSISILVKENIFSDTVDIRVMNSGPLLTSEISTKIFEPFFSTKSLGQGTGLGLSISQTLAHSNNGFLSYEEYQNKVCFKLQLPVQVKD